MRVAEILLRRSLPEPLRGIPLQMDQRGVSALLARVADDHPEAYSDVAKRIVDLGRMGSWRQGESMRLQDLRPIPERDAILKEMDREVDALRKELGNSDEFKRERERVWLKYSSLMEKTTADVGNRNLNAIALSVSSGARGKYPQLQALISTPGVYQDSRGRTIPVFVRRSFAEGMRPIEWLAGTFGARTSVISTKRATAKGGDFGKQAAQASMGLVVTRPDCHTDNGIDLEVSDPNVLGRVTAREVAGIPAGTVVDRKVWAKLKQGGGIGVFRSAITCTSPTGLCAKCSGAGPRYKLPKVGDMVGITAAQAISEPITQSALNTKHLSGQGKERKVFSGFDVINQFVQAPDEFPDRQPLSTVSGTVDRVEPAPQGGTYVWVGDEKHYVLPNYALFVKAGDTVERGQALADGLANPSDMVELRGIGSGRRYYAKRLKQILDDSGMKARMLDTEKLARAALSHVVINDPEGLGDYLPDDVVNYDSLTSRLQLDNLRKVKLSEASGKYLARPALHYSIGTQLQPSQIKRLEKAGWKDLDVVDEPLQFTPSMTRLRSAAHEQGDWLAQQSTSYLQRNLVDSAVAGLDTNIKENPHPAPRIAYGVGFGEKLEETGKF